MFEVFNSRDKMYISQTVPVKAGDSLRFSVLLHDNCNCSDACLIIRTDNGPSEWIHLTWAEKIAGEFNRWEVNYTPQTAGLYWYRFEYDGNWQRNKIMCVGSGKGDINCDGTEWQLTVYEPDYVTPDRFSGGLIYQIFPDRFHASGEPKDNVPQDRFIQTDWYAQPQWRQDNGTDSLCNDYYGGDLKGITQKLGYIESLGVTVIYLNPIFEAHSNHRYNTADYMKVDPLLGTEDDFVDLCKEAKKHGISVILDGVFSHTGDDSIYFNRYSRYESNGAYNSPDSPYSSWFKFICWPDKYHSWWGIPSLPETVEEDKSFTEFICGENGVLRHWMRLGASGWRLDVADELPDVFLDEVRKAIKAENPNALLIGEVWEDASNKISYGGRRRFILGRQLDSVMNYPFRNAIIAFLMGGDAHDFEDAVMSIVGNYPKCALDLLMNHIGTHDTERILSVLGGARLDFNRADQSRVALTGQQRSKGLALLRLAAVMQYTLPGIPSLYYGDEAGMEGLRDPFNRAGYPWNREDHSLVLFYKKLGEIRKNPVFAGGDFQPVWAENGLVAYMRVKDKKRIMIAVNRDEYEHIFNFEGTKYYVTPYSYFIEEI